MNDYAIVMTWRKIIGGESMEGGEREGGLMPPVSINLY